jgi:hypothetical protein
MSFPKVQIDIIIKDDQLYGTRYWTHIPRKGDHIRLDGKKAGWYLIEEINWQGQDYPIVVLIVSKSDDS